MPDDTSTGTGKTDDGTKADDGKTGTSATAADDKQQDKTLTQAEVDRIVQERVARERAKYADYDDLKAKAKAAETDQERAVREAAEKARNEALSEVGQQRLEDRIRVKAAKALNDPEDAVRLIDREGLDPSDSKLDDTLTQRINKLLEDKPYLGVSDARQSGSGDAGSKRQTAQPGDMNALIRSASGR